MIERRRHRSAVNTISERITRLAMIGLAGGAVVGMPTAFGLLAAQAPHDVAEVATESEIADAPIVEGNEAALGTVSRARDGLFYVALQANGARMRCLVDTGASAMVLSSTEAARIGVTPHGGRYTGSIATAGGSRAATRERLAGVDVAGRHFANVPVILVRGGGTPCLMGQEMLARLDAVEIRGDELHLR